MPAKTAQQPVFLPYRDDNNISVRYAAAIPSSYQNLTEASPYDSDFEPLITSPIASDLDEDALMHFTATGRPVPVFKGSALSNLGGMMYTAPQLLPKRYTDDSIIPAIIKDVIPSENKVVEPKKKKGFLGKLKGAKKEETKNENGVLRVVFMPRREYQKYFARDEKGEYIGTEPYRQWTEEELEQKYGKYKPVKEQKKGYRV
jgi:hypothetical protein